MEKFKPGRCIGRGASGFVYKVDGSDENLVMKVEKKSSRSRLPNEYIAYSRLKGVSGIPSVKAFQESTKTHVMVMDHAGVSLHEMFQRRDMLPQGSIQHLVAYFGYQMINILRAVHSEGVIHGDIHPGNFTYFSWRDRETSVRLIDFGAAAVQGRQEPKEQCNQVNYWFASAERLSTRLKKPSVVDDLISLAYSFIHILKESLPWAEYIDASGQPTDLQGIIILKTLVQPQALCADLDSVFSDFLSYVQKLRRSASCRDIDYDSHIQAFRDFFESKFKGRV